MSEYLELKHKQGGSLRIMLPMPLTVLSKTISILASGGWELETVRVPGEG